MSKDAQEKIAELIEAKYGRLIMKIAYDITKDYEAAQEIKKDVLYKCAMKSETLANMCEGKFYSYICTAAKNTALNELKRKQNEIARQEKYIEENWTNLAIDYVDFKAFEETHGLSPETTRMLAMLNQTDRSILLLKFCVGMSNEETAEALNLKVETVKKRYQRAKIRLMNSFIESEGDEIDEQE